MLLPKPVSNAETRLLLMSCAGIRPAPSIVCPSALVTVEALESSCASSVPPARRRVPVPVSEPLASNRMVALPPDVVGFSTIIPLLITPPFTNRARFGSSSRVRSAATTSCPIEALRSPCTTANAGARMRAFSSAVFGISAGDQLAALFQFEVPPTQSMSVWADTATAAPASAARAATRFFSNIFRSLRLRTQARAHQPQRSPAPREINSI